MKKVLITGANSYIGMSFEKYVQDNFVWTDNMEIIAKKLQKVSKVLNGTLETELADKILAGVI